MTHVDHGMKHRPKRLGGTDPIPGIEGDYVFLQEIVADADAFTFEFTDIDQDFRHLKLEGMLSDSEETTPSSPASGLAYDVEVDWANGDGTDYSYLFVKQGWSTGPGSLSYPYMVVTEASDTSVLRIDDVLPSKFVELNPKTRMGLYFRYYAVADEHRFMRMEAEAYDPNYDSHAVFFHGSANLGPDNSDPFLAGQPITNLTITSSNGFSEGSRFSMYGIR